MHPKVVLDTNVIISAVAFPQGKLKFIWDAWKAGAFDLILSEKLFDEIERKINIVGRKYKMNFSEIREVLGAIRDTGIFVKVGEVPNVTRDPKDNIVVATAISGRADLLVSGAVLRF